MTWSKKIIKNENVKAETTSSVKITMPEGSKYEGFEFWHPKKLIYPVDGNDNAFKISFHSEWLFTLNKYAKGKTNRFEVVESVEITAEEMNKTQFIK